MAAVARKRPDRPPVRTSKATSALSAIVRPLPESAARARHQTPMWFRRRHPLESRPAPEPGSLTLLTWQDRDFAEADRPTLLRVWEVMTEELSPAAVLTFRRCRFVTSVLSALMPPPHIAAEVRFEGCDLDWRPGAG